MRGRMARPRGNGKSEKEFASAVRFAFTRGVKWLRRVLILALVLGASAPSETRADGWRFWKRKTTVVSDAAGPVEKQTVERAGMDRDAVEKQIRDSQRARARSEKKRQKEMARAQRDREREIRKRQRDVEREQEKLQREQRGRLKALSRRYEGKKGWNWRFWRKSESKNDFFLQQN